jgi:hypothetical protein
LIKALIFALHKAYLEKFLRNNNQALGMIHSFNFKSIYRSRYLFLIFLGCLIFVLQAGDNIASGAREFAHVDLASPSKSDRLMPQAKRVDIRGIRLAHLWDGTPEAELNKMPSPKADRLILAYASQAQPQSDAIDALQRFDNENTVKLVPQPKPRPVKALAAKFAKKIMAPMALLSKNFAKPTLMPMQQPSPTQEQEVKLASIAPASLPSAVEATEAVSALNLPYTLQIASVKTGCFPEKLVGLMKKIEDRYHKKVIVTSGLRERGRKGSLHLHCAAADIIVPGVPSIELARFARTLPEVGGVGRYCHPYMIHIDIGGARDWIYGCKRREAHS